MTRAQRPRSGRGRSATLCLALAVVGVVPVATAISFAVAAAPSPGPPVVRALAHQLEPGDFLIASAKLDDANFAQSVVLLIEAGPDGVAGVVVNRPTPVRLAVVMPQVEVFRDRPDRIWWGGPVQPQNAVMLVRLPNPPPDAEKVVDDVYLIRTPSAMESVLGQGLPDGALRVYSGYAGWAGGQLEWEMTHGSWYVHRATADQIFATDGEKLWDQLVRIASAPLA